MKIAVIGKTGQLAHALKTYLPDAAYYGRKDLDLSAPPETLSAFMSALPPPDIVIIAAAYTNVDKAESQPELAYAVNVRAPAIIAKHCAKRGIGLIYISTDCVFDGKSKSAYAPQDTPHPVNFYGATKLEGERAVMQAHPSCTIVRTSWVYAPGHTNFMSKMIEIGAARGALNVVADQIGRPTYAPDLAEALITLAEKLSRNGIILAGGTGTRLHPSTISVSKQLMPVFDKPMIYYPLCTLMEAGLSEILIITTPQDQPAFKHLLGDGSRWGLTISHAAQPSPDGLAQALIIAEEFLDGAPSALILGDNLFFGDAMSRSIRSASAQSSGATIFGYPVKDGALFLR